MASAEPTWLALLLAKDFEADTQESRGLWSVASSTADSTYQRMFKDLAVSRAARAQLSLEILDHLPPDTISPQLRKSLEAFSPRYIFNHTFPALRRKSVYCTLTDAIRGNVGALRARYILSARGTTLSRLYPKLEIFKRSQLVLDTIDEALRASCTAIEKLGSRYDLVPPFRRAIRAVSRAVAEEPLETLYNRRYGIEY